VSAQERGRGSDLTLGRKRKEKEDREFLTTTPVGGTDRRLENPARPIWRNERKAKGNGDDLKIGRLPTLHSANYTLSSLFGSGTRGGGRGGRPSCLEVENVKKSETLGHITLCALPVASVNGGRQSSRPDLGTWKGAMLLDVLIGFKAAFCTIQGRVLIQGVMKVNRHTLSSLPTNAART